MTVDAEYEIVVDAALAFGGLDQHDALKLPLRRKCACVNSTNGVWFPLSRHARAQGEPRTRKRRVEKSGVASGLGSTEKQKAARRAAVLQLIAKQ